MNDIKRQLTSTSISTHVTQAEIDMARTEIALAAHPQSAMLLGPRAQAAARPQRSTHKRNAMRTSPNGEGTSW